jgi:hypothetical protein
MSDAQKTYPLHTRYTWEVTTVPLEKAKETLDGLSCGTHEIVLTQVHTAPSDGAPYMIIVARQSHVVSVTIRDQQLAGSLLQRGFNLSGTVALDGIYTSECTHIRDTELASGMEFPKCNQCRKQVKWRAVKLYVLERAAAPS